ncbi:hypothetical protein KWM_0118550 [Xanthomonas vasicola pv. musacearum NCPPB 2005]|nr:hypothetical protein KWQ_0121715 [Xanthomonas vasicola pv. musacearum NCPPB 4380]KFA05666.1 hypothetical protein KWM_0118550 [Xanthomonas vasicola pv. musacearum NCPPB 2005]KFA19012.1 hypothetical protein A11G_0109405 [Xanthomonas vasicola pv. musacearum NCPPB 4392]KFA19346.1 hypothetical protein KWU_0117630 [Xanthomonas vasicola pv. musacearum NCPPB 4394]KFA26325.1 hypothetical protein KWS_0119055 [Xanthomonas vasicola pv. musacearum NCPPB 4384]
MLKSTQEIVFAQPSQYSLANFNPIPFVDRYYIFIIGPMMQNAERNAVLCTVGAFIKCHWHNMSRFNEP